MRCPSEFTQMKWDNPTIVIPWGNWFSNRVRSYWWSFHLINSKMKITIQETLKLINGTQVLIKPSIYEYTFWFYCKENTDITLLVAMIVLLLSVWNYDVEGNEGLLLKMMVQKLPPRYCFNPIRHMIILGTYNTCCKRHFLPVIVLNQFLRNVVCLKRRTAQWKGIAMSQSGIQ